MSQAKSSSKGKRRSKAASVLGIAGVSLAVADGGASASIADMTAQNTAPLQVINLGDEEISDVSLATFYVFDKETARTPQAGVQLARGCGGCRGCGGGWGCGGCGGCGCCLSWGACRWC